MASNYSQRRRLSVVMQQPLGSYLGWRLEIVCPACRDRKVVPIEQLLLSCAGHHPMQSVISRLRCSVSSCRRPPDFVKLVGPLDGSPGHPAQEVMLVGPGAY